MVQQMVEVVVKHIHVFDNIIVDMVLVWHDLDNHRKENTTMVVAT